MTETFRCILIVGPADPWFSELGRALAEQGRTIAVARDEAEMRRRLTTLGDSIDAVILDTRIADPIAIDELVSQAPALIMIADERIRFDSLWNVRLRGVVSRRAKVDEVIAQLARVRANVDARASVHTRERRSGIIADISGGGMQIAFDASPSPSPEAALFSLGDEVDIRWRMDDAASVDLSVTAEVRWVRVEKGRLFMGARYVSMSEPTWHAIARLLENYSAFREGRLTARVIDLSQRTR